MTLQAAYTMISMLQSFEMNHNTTLLTVCDQGKIIAVAVPGGHVKGGRGSFTFGVRREDGFTKFAFEVSYFRVLGYNGL